MFPGSNLKSLISSSTNEVKEALNPDEQHPTSVQQTGKKEWPAGNRQVHGDRDTTGGDEEEKMRKDNSGTE